MTAGSYPSGFCCKVSVHHSGIYNINWFQKKSNTYFGSAALPTRCTTFFIAARYTARYREIPPGYSRYREIPLYLYLTLYVYLYGTEKVTVKPFPSAILNGSLTGIVSLNVEASRAALSVDRIFKAWYMIQNHIA